MAKKAQDFSIVVKMIALVLGLLIGIYLAYKFAKPLFGGGLP